MYGGSSGETSIQLTSWANTTDLVYENASWKNALAREQSQQEATEHEANHRKDAGKF